MENSGELIVRLLEAIDELDPSDDKSASKIASYLYIPDPRISVFLSKLEKYLEIQSPNKRQLKEAGDLLEQVAILAFRGLKGITLIKSFRSAGPQYDLLISGDDYHWFLLYRLFYMSENRRDIVIEAKCTTGTVSDQQFARFCSLMGHNLFQTVGVGVFFTLNGATGFPKRGDPRQRKIGAARLRQVLFHARTGQSIVVLDAEDIFELDKPASLVQLIMKKIRDLEHLSGLNLKELPDHPEIDVPNHLASLVQDLIST